MPTFPASTETPSPAYRSDVLVGDGHHIVDRLVAASSTFAAFSLVILDSGKFRPCTAIYAEADAWEADTAYTVGDVVLKTTTNNHYYQAIAVTGDAKSHATTEPTWPTNGGTVVDDAVTWQDMGLIDDLSAESDLGILGVSEPVVTGVGETPTLPVIQSGQVSLAQCFGVPSTYVAGQWLGHLLLEV